jgi:FkbM family methyltransferase
MKTFFALARKARGRAQHLAMDFLPRRFSRASYSQSGEDMIVDFALKAMRIDNPSYLDIGANHPFVFSNTYHFYTKGCFGVSVEPDPRLHALLVKKRPKEVHLNLGVSAGKAEKLPFFIMSNSTLNTFSEEEALRYSRGGTFKIEQILQVDLIPISKIFDEYFGGKAADFLSVDVEGMDLDIVKSIDFENYRPLVICIETIIFSENRDGGKVAHIADFLISQGYMVYADTHINTIFVDRERWSSV